ncbi:MAG: tRNA (guanosine(37)-N1)-methyltransferase TrmD, partial [Oscillospiraceae bacterium]|nr:tRNA (guanosine(37)-N1)-methyltransferase TrmD [Oscillospiraceae bacterium]
MRIDIATLFPEMCETVMGESIVGRARRANMIEIHCHQIRDYTLDKHRRVDDSPYGGGKGMVMQCDPIYRC